MVKEQIVGQIVINKKDEKLVVKDCVLNINGIVDTVTCEMIEDGGIKRYGSEPFDHGFLRFENQSMQEMVEQEIVIREEAKKAIRISSERAFEDYKKKAWEKAQQKAKSKPASTSSRSKRTRLSKKV